MFFIEEGVHEERLERVLNGDMDSGDNLTKLYRQILESSFPNPDGHTISVFHHVMGAVIQSKVPLCEEDLPHFTSEPMPSVKSILSKLSIVLSTTADGRVRISHSSFTEFICDRRQCPEPFYIDQQATNERLMMACFQLMRQQLKFNICGLESSYLRNDEVKDLAQPNQNKNRRFFTVRMSFVGVSPSRHDGERI